MDWKRAWQEERAALMRIAALLHALARLADCAAGRSAGVRAFVLWLLRHAGAVARDFVAGQGTDGLAFPLGADPFGADSFGADDPGPAALIGWQPGHRPKDAARLAASLRALAWQVEALAALLSCHGEGRAGRAGRLRERRLPAACRAPKAAMAIVALPAPDTS